MSRKPSRPDTQIDDGEWITIEWAGQRERCCGCGLVHVMDFRVADGDASKPDWAPAGSLQFRARQAGK